MILSTDRGRGQRRLTADAVDTICAHYGWQPAPGYFDPNGCRVFIGTDYAGTAVRGTLRLDRDLGAIVEIPVG